MIDKITSRVNSNRSIWDDYDQLTGLELVKAIIKKINEIVSTTNEYTVVVQELRNWFNALNVQTEINKKLDEMETNGILARIINQQLFSELDDKIKTKNEYVYVEDYGAKGDGVTNDTTAFANAIASGYNVMCKKGKTYVVKNLYINRVNFILNGNGSKMKVLTPGDSCIMITPQCVDITIKGLSFSGVADGILDTSAGVNVMIDSLFNGRNTSAQDIKIYECKFLGKFVFSIIASGTTGLYIHHCFFTDNMFVPNKSAGGYGILTQTCYDVYIYRNKFEGKLRDRHAIYISCDNSIHPTIDKANENVFIYGNNIDWTNVEIKNGGETAFTSRTVRNLNVFDNHIKGGLGGFGVSCSHGDTINVDIHDNVFEDIKSNGTNDRFIICAIKSEVVGYENSYNYNVKIHDNIMKTNSLGVHGIVMSQVDGYEVYNNQMILNENLARGFAFNPIDCKNGRFYNNNVNGVFRNGICFSAGYITNLDISSNIFTGSQKQLEIFNTPVLTNIKFRDLRSVWIYARTDGTYTVTDTNNLVNTASITSIPTGFTIDFNGVFHGDKSNVELVVSTGILGRYVVNAVSANQIKVDLFDTQGVAKPLLNSGLAFYLKFRE